MHSLLVIGIWIDDQLRGALALLSPEREVRDDYPQVRFLTTMAPGHDGWKFVCDLDHFKGYNDRLGHTAGDRAMGTVLLRSIRQVDLAARYGGEEFTVVLIDTTSAGALDVAERICAGVAVLDLGSPDSGFTVSVGVASFPNDAALTEELIDKADWAMYMAKRQGRDPVLPFRPGAPDQTSRTTSPRRSTLGASQAK